MRKKNRVKRITNLLIKVWSMMPELRFNQLLFCILREANLVEFHPLNQTMDDIFNIEDSKFEEAIQKFLKRNAKKLSGEDRKEQASLFLQTSKNRSKLSLDK